MEDSIQKGISVVIPNYNGESLLPLTLPPLFDALQTTGLHFEVIVCDDASVDSSVEWLKNSFPLIVLIQNVDNIGFSPTVNKGIAKARYSYTLILNSDVMLPPDYFSALFRYFDRPDTFGVMSRIIGWETDTIQDGGKIPSWQGLKIKTSGNFVPLVSNTEKWLPSMYLSGANAMVDTEKLKALGGFNERFAPFYIEDAELSIRAWRLGWKCYYEHNSFCRHKESVTIKSKNKKAYIKRIYNRNKMWMHAIHLPAGYLVFWHLQLLLETIFSLLSFRLFFVKAFGDYLKKIPELRGERKAFMQVARILKIQPISLPGILTMLKNQLRTIPHKRI